MLRFLLAAVLLFVGLTDANAQTATNRNLGKKKVAYSARGARRK